MGRIFQHPVCRFEVLFVASDEKDTGTIVDRGGSEYGM